MGAFRQIVGQIFSESRQLLLNFLLRVVAFVVRSPHESVPQIDNFPFDHVLPGLTFQSGRPKTKLGAQPFVPVVVGRSSKGVLDVVEGDAGVAEKVANCTLSQI
ncbi:hypothetical protein TYRP_023523 [Tyrophagus putrescentiae]|nr:hypothetical protein TYRP_023523 [Tyrophagus putrescentiae]